MHDLCNKVASPCSSPQRAHTDRTHREIPHWAAPGTDEQAGAGRGLGKYSCICVKEGIYVCSFFLSWPCSTLPQPR